MSALPLIRPQRWAVTAAVSPTPTGGLYVVVASDNTIWALTDNYGRFSDWRELPALPDRK